MNTNTIQSLNDAFRQSFLGGQVVMTQGVAQLDPERQQSLFRTVQQHTEFTLDNDPHGEHDFGRIEAFGSVFYWKIDYYDKSLQQGSEDPSDPACTTRVLTLMRAEEY